MMKTAWVLLALLGFSTLAAARAPSTQPLGSLTQVRGVVMVSNGNGLDTAQRDTPVYDGTRVVASLTGAAELSLGRGCVLRLNPNEQVVLRSQLGCDCLRAAIQTASRASSQVQMAAARTPIGRVTQARGVVTVSDGASVGVAEQGMRIVDGARFVSSPLGGAEIAMNNGCTVNLKANESLVVRDQLGCDCLRALVESVPGVPAPSLPSSFVGINAATGPIAAIGSSLSLSYNAGTPGGQIKPPILSGQ